MGGLIDLLAVLDGWDYRTLTGTIAVQPGVITEVFAERVPGWIIGASFDSTDAFAHITVTMPPETFPVLDSNIFDVLSSGFIQPYSSSLAATLFDFPNLPLSSTGLGVVTFNLTYPLPLKKENVVHITFTLDPATTVPFAVVDYVVIFMQIYRMDLFQKSLKDLFNVKKPL